MIELQSLLSLPLATVAMLASGYLGYRLAYAGRDKTHRSIDVVFLSLVFAFSAQLAAGLMRKWVGEPTLELVGLATALAAAAVWRSWLTDRVFRVLRWSHITTSDGHASAWDTIRHKTGFSPTTYLVRTSGGILYMCQTPERYDYLRDGPCILGDDGSVALFVTHRKEPGDAHWVEREVYDPVLGYEMTYVPAGQIVEIRICTLS